MPNRDNRVVLNQWGDIAPYALAIAELTDGTRMMAQVTDCNVDEVKNEISKCVLTHSLHIHNSVTL